MTYPTYAEDIVDREFPTLAMVSVWFGVLIVSVTAVGYSVSSPFGPSRAEPLVDMLEFIWLALMLASIVTIFVPAEGGIKVRAMPLMINLGTFIILQLVPFGAIWEAVRFQYHWQGYQTVIEKVESGEWQPDSNGGVALPLPYRHLSADNGRIWVHRADGFTAIFFVTEQRGLHHFTGYLYRSDGRPPQSNNFSGQWRHIIQKQKNWFYCASG